MLPNRKIKYMTQAEDAYPTWAQETTKINHLRSGASINMISVLRDKCRFTYGIFGTDWSRKQTVKPPARLSRNVAVLLTASVLALLATFANAQGEHMTHAGPYTVRATALKSEFIPDSVAREHNLDPGPEKGILNVVVLKKMPDGQRITVPAAVIAYQRNLLDQRQTVEMRSVKQNDRISYLGTFEFDQLSNFRFTVEVLPQGSEETITLDFEDKF